jgi:hypothetical protein
VTAQGAAVFAAVASRKARVTASGLDEFAAAASTNALVTTSGALGFVVGGYPVFLTSPRYVLYRRPVSSHRYSSVV